ncbi:hypothetical protein TrST_g11139 [Triparma strigata]|uniref:Uncharacterized protein n=1 Tax=Triparma strigata TaxID=1606541 RepID=A0A9W7F0P5_9STRA|nr:hypothetical protein TrST_g11139 [Triparma strigata]
MSRYCFVGATLDLKASNEEPKVNHWCELSSLRLFDASGKNVAPLVSRISFTQKPDGNQDPNKLVNGRTWPEQEFSCWENGKHLHNGCRLVEFQFAADVDIVRCVCLTTNCESFGTNPRVEKWNGSNWVTYLHTSKGGGLSVRYLAANSPIGGYPGSVLRVNRDGEEAVMNDCNRNPNIAFTHGDDRTYVGHDQSMWMWNPSNLMYERGSGSGLVNAEAEIAVPAVAVGLGAMTMGGLGGTGGTTGGAPFCVNCGLKFIGKFCAQCGTPQSSIPMMAPMAAPAIFNVVSNFQMEEQFNFVEGANYSQIDLNGDEKNRPLNWLVQFGAKKCDEQGKYGFFYQQHTNGHEIMGFYETPADMNGKKVKHGHARGFLAARR